jgi:hypothetical protein
MSPAGAQPMAHDSRFGTATARQRRPGTCRSSAKTGFSRLPRQGPNLSAFGRPPPRPSFQRSPCVRSNTTGRQRACHEPASLSKVGPSTESGGGHLHEVTRRTGRATGRFEETSSDLISAALGAEAVYLSCLYNASLAAIHVSPGKALAGRSREGSQWLAILGSSGGVRVFRGYS